MESNYLTDYEGARRAVEIYAGGRRDMCWGTMIYVCTGKTVRNGDRTRFNVGACGHEERYWVGVGVEGPPDLRARVLSVSKSMPMQGWEPGWAEEHKRRLQTIGGVSFIPSPFFAGECPRCRGGMRHDCWDQDEEWQEFRRPPKGTRVFLVPNEAKAREYARVNYGGAELVLAD